MPQALTYPGVYIEEVPSGVRSIAGVATWESAYGRTLLLKLALLSAVFGTGAYNWLRVRPALGSEVAAGRLRRSAALELAVGVVVLAVTAVLVATATPSPVGPRNCPQLARISSAVGPSSAVA